MDKKWLVLGAFLLIIGLAKAQQPRNGGMRLNPDERAKRTVEMLDKELQLNQTQKDSIYQFSLAEAKEQQTLFQSGRDESNRRASFEKMRTLREKSQQKIKGVLNDEQVKKYDTLLKERQNRMGGRRGGRNA
ncbi:hypothetical protein RYH73_02300 [Olivibacter sp. CPCC 100613]|uniref:hypothetical protein n=1 Tax=Olivibacter sp. CPCC 100613 TaxID=3079931 RepID=UPI002FFA931C